MATAGEIWGTLSKVDVSDHVEKKGNLSYLSWAWAWGVLMKHFPQAEYQFKDDEVLPDGSVMTCVEMRIGDVVRTMHLPVMDNRNQSIFGPTSRQISDARMRCLVKCIAMFGLGHYIYAGEDMPAPPTPEQAERQYTTPPVPMDDPPVSPMAGSPQTPPDQAQQLSQPQPPGAPSQPTADHIDTPEAAAEMRKMLCQMATTFCEDETQLRDFWRTNRSIIDILRTQYPEEYKALQETFTNLKSRMGAA